MGSAVAWVTLLRSGSGRGVESQSPAGRCGVRHDSDGLRRGCRAPGGAAGDGSPRTRAERWTTGNALPEASDRI